MIEVSNEKALKIIEQQYAGFINLNEKWDFFRGLAEYTKTLEALAPTKPIIELVEAQRKAARALYGSMNTDALKELTKSGEEIIKISEKIAKQNEPLVNAVKELHDNLSLRILSSDRLTELNNSLFGVAQRLRQSGLLDVLKKYEDGQKKINSIYTNHTFSPTYEKLDDEKKKIERQEQVETWGAWQKLPLVKRLVFEPEKMIEDVRAEVAEDPSLQWNLINLYGIAGEMEKIRSGQVSDNDVVYFRLKDFRGYAQRLHNFVTRELLQTQNENRLEFDPKSSILIFQGKEILIAKSKDTDPHYLLQTLFNEPTKVWNYDEIASDWKTDFDKTKWKRFYNAAHKVNQKVAGKTTIADFLEATKKTSNINKKYLT